ncbi:MAG TPA: YciI family protein [Candidatus Limnocylindrales bacterium]|nr:YciI family protein [Candidatus Limnocylindrales bacterium]
MKYVLLFVGTMEDQKRFESQSTEEMQAAMAGAMNWFETYSQAGKIVGGEQLKGPETATTVRFKDGKPLVTDGPFIESKEIIGGFAVVDVKDLDEALDMAKSWPAGPVEVWPAVER